MKPLRLDYTEVDRDAVRPLFDIGRNVSKGTLETTLRELVEVRISQLNGCAFCIDLHGKRASDHGERQQRLDLLAHFRELPFYTDREKAALSWAESLTRVSETHVNDEEYEAATRFFGEKELLDLTMLVVLMNAWNRIAVAFRHMPEER